MAGITVSEFKEAQRKINEHDDFINGVTPNGQDGAKTRITRIEDSLLRRDKASNYIIGACITVTVSVLIWLITTVLPNTIDKMALVLR